MPFQLIYKILNIFSRLCTDDMLPLFTTYIIFYPLTKEIISNIAWNCVRYQECCPARFMGGCCPFLRRLAGKKVHNTKKLRHNSYKITQWCIQTVRQTFGRDHNRFTLFYCILQSKNKLLNISRHKSYLRQLRSNFQIVFLWVLFNYNVTIFLPLF